MRGRKFWPGYLHLNPRAGTTIFEAVGSTMWEAGSYKLRNIGIGLGFLVAVNLILRPCSAMEVQELARPILGKRAYWGKEKRC